MPAACRAALACTLMLDTPAGYVNVHCTAETGEPDVDNSRLVETGFEDAVTDDKVRDCASRDVSKRHPAVNVIIKTAKDLIFLNRRPLPPFKRAFRLIVRVF